MSKHAAEPEPRPQPVLTRAGVVTALAVLSALLVKSGAGDVSSWLAGQSDAIAGVVLAVAPLVSGLLARRHVTPIVAPVDAAGKPLKPAAPVVEVAASSLSADEAAAIALAASFDGP